MKSFIRLLLILLPLAATAQSSLPQCPTGTIAYSSSLYARPGRAGALKDNCYGPGVDIVGRYIGKWRDGKFHGSGRLHPGADGLH